MQAPDAPAMTAGSVLASLPWEFCLGYGLLIFVRRRWFNIALLAAGLVFYGWQVVPDRLTG